MAAGEAVAVQGVGDSCMLVPTRLRVSGSQHGSTASKSAPATTCWGIAAVRNISTCGRQHNGALANRPAEANNPASAQCTAKRHLPHVSCWRMPWP